jgi:hypothetical protein
MSFSLFATVRQGDRRSSKTGQTNTRNQASERYCSLHASYGANTDKRQATEHISQRKHTLSVLKMACTWLAPLETGYSQMLSLPLVSACSLNERYLTTTRKGTRLRHRILERPIFGIKLRKAESQLEIWTMLSENPRTIHAAIVVVSE